LDVCHTCRRGVALVRIYDAGLKRAARSSLKIQDAKTTQKIPHLGTIVQLCRAESSQLRHVSTIGKILLNSNIFSTCFHNMANFGSLTAELCLPVSGTPANFNGFRVLASLLQRRRSTEVNQTLHDLWSSPGLVHYVYIFLGMRGAKFRQGLLPPDGILPRAKLTLRPSLAFSCIYLHRYCTALQQRRQPNIAVWYKKWNY